MRVQHFYGVLNGDSVLNVSRCDIMRQLAQASGWRGIIIFRMSIYGGRENGVKKPPPRPIYLYPSFCHLSVCRFLSVIHNKGALVHI